MTTTIIEILPNLGLVGGTAAKVKLLVEKSKLNYIVLYAPNKKNELYIEEWSRITCIKLIEGYSLSNPIKNARLLSRLITKYNCDIIHAYFPIDSVSAALTKIAKPKIKIVRSFEGVLPYTRSKKCIQSLSFLLHNRCIAISKYVEKFYCNFFGNIIKPISTVYNCPAFDNIETVERDFQKNYLLSIGGLNPSKNTETMIEAVKILKSKGVEVEYHVLGDGPLRQEAENLIDKYNLRDNIFLHGFQANVKDYLNRCSIYVHPANNEGFGMAVVEAMSRKCPVLVSDSCALPELIENGKSGFILPTYDATAWADKIVWLLNHPDECHRLGEFAYERYITNFSIETFIKNIEDIYKSLNHKQHIS